LLHQAVQDLAASQRLRQSGYPIGLWAHLSMSLAARDDSKQYTKSGGHLFAAPLRQKHVQLLPRCCTTRQNSRQMNDGERCRAHGGSFPHSGDASTLLTNMLCLYFQSVQMLRTLAARKGLELLLKSCHRGRPTTACSLKLFVSETRPLSSISKCRKLALPPDADCAPAY